MCHRAIWAPGSGKKHASAVIEPTDAVESAYGREFAKASIVSAGGDLFVDGFQGSSADMDEYFVFGGKGFRKLFETRRVAERVQYGGVHFYLSRLWIRLSVNSVVPAVPPTSRVRDFPSR